MAITVVATLGLFISIGAGPAWSLAASAALLIALWPARPSRDEVEALWRDFGKAMRSAWVMWILVGVLAAIQILLTIISLSRFGDIGWDGAWYHLPIVGAMIQEGSLFDWPSLNPFMYYPALVEVQAAFIGLITGSVRAASLIQVGYWVWLIVFVAGFVAHRANQTVAAVTALTIAAVPTMWLETRTFYVDIALGVTLAAAAVAAILAYQNRHRLLLLVAALLTGSLFAMKLGASAAVPVAIAVAIVAFSSPHMRRLVLLVSFLGVVAVTPFLIRNAIEWQNPVYPLSLSKPNVEVTAFAYEAPFSMAEMRFQTDAVQRPEPLQGLSTPDAIVKSYVFLPLRETSRAITGSGTPPSFWTYHYASREGGYGTAWLVLVALSAVVGLFAVVRRTSLRFPRTGIVVLSGSLVIVGTASLVITQAPWWPRFTLGACFTIAIAAALVVAKRRWSTIALVVVAVPLSIFSIVASEQNGGVPFWQDAVSLEEQALLEATGLSIFTPDYAPLVFDDARSIYVFEDSPEFPAGLWGRDWDVDVSLHDLDELASDAVPLQCPDAVLVPTEHLQTVEGWLMGADARVRNLVPWDDRGRPLLWLTGITCPAS